MSAQRVLWWRACMFARGFAWSRALLQTCKRPPTRKRPAHGAHTTLTPRAGDNQRWQPSARCARELRPIDVTCHFLLAPFESGSSPTRPSPWLACCPCAALWSGCVGALAHACGLQTRQKLHIGERTFKPTPNVRNPAMLQARGGGWRWHSAKSTATQFLLRAPLLPSHAPPPVHTHRRRRLTFPITCTSSGCSC